MTEKTQQWALITGASKGIGLELAQCFAKAGINLILVARSEIRLVELAQRWQSDYGIQIIIIAVDLSEEHAVDSVYDQIVRKQIQINFLVNNAGIGLFGKYDVTDIDREHQMIKLNCLALARLTKLFLPGMIQNGSGRILNVASIAAFQPGPYQAVYFATKAFVLSFSEAIAEDLAEKGIYVTALCPGLTATDFIDSANMENSGFVKRTKLASPQRVAEQGFRAMMKGKRVVVPGWFDWITTLLPRLVPRRLVTRVVAKMMADGLSGRELHHQP